MGSRSSLLHQSFDKRTSNKRASITRFVTAGIEDRDGDLWMGTRSAVLRFSPNNQAWAIYRLPDRLAGVLGVYEDAIGRIWFSDAKGCVAAFDKADNSWSVHDLAESLRKSNTQFRFVKFSVNGLCQDNSGLIIFATDVGLISFREETDECLVYTTDNSRLLDNSVSSLLKDKIGKIWIGTAKGIVVLEP